MIPEGLRIMQDSCMDEKKLTSIHNSGNWNPRGMARRESRERGRPKVDVACQQLSPPSCNGDGMNE